MKRTIVELMRPNVAKMQGYKSARHEYQGSANILLDANENPFDWDYNRYPDPHHFRLKRELWKTLGWDMAKISLGNGSDELIDLLIRAFCEPGKDAIRVLNPSYGMYKVTAELNNVEVIKTDLDEDFQLDPSLAFIPSTPPAGKINKEKIFFLTSPNNPTGNAFHQSLLEDIISRYDGIVVVDEAYVDFSSRGSLYTLIDKYPNLVILRTMSKAFGAAGLRIGIALADGLITNVLHKIKPPYNLSTIVQEQAITQLGNYTKILTQSHLTMADRDRLAADLRSLFCVERVFPSDANFLLIKTNAADEIYDFLRKKGIIVRNRSSDHGCFQCLRFTVGTPVENKALLTALNEYDDLNS